MSPRMLSLALLLAPILSPPGSQAQLPDFFGGDEFSVNLGPAVECTQGLKLIAAAGVPFGAERRYTFQGICKLIQVGKKSSGKTFTHVGNVWTVGVLSWSKNGDLREDLKVKGDHGGYAVDGKISMVLKCTTDPVLNPPACVKGQYVNESGWAGFDLAFLAAKPIVPKTTVQEATMLSQKELANKSSSTPPPPPPPPAHKQPAGLKQAKPAQPRAPVGLRQAGPVAAISSPVVVTDSLARVTIPMAPGIRILLESGRIVATREQDGELRWAILGPGHELETTGQDGRLRRATVGPGDEVLRLFPSGSRAMRNGLGDIFVDWGGGVTNAGRARSDVSRLSEAH